MTTAAARLVALAGTGGTAGALLQLLAAGVTTGAALVAYSGLPSATAATHLLTDRVVAPVEESGFSGAVIFAPRRRPIEEDEAILLAVLH